MGRERGGWRGGDESRGGGVEEGVRHFCACTDCLIGHESPRSGDESQSEGGQAIAARSFRTRPRSLPLAGAACAFFARCVCAPSSSVTHPCPRSRARDLHFVIPPHATRA